MCAGTASSKHPSVLKEGRRRGTTLGVGLEPRPLDFGSQGPSHPARGRDGGEACPHFSVYRALLPRHPLSRPGWSDSGSDLP